MKAWRRRSGWKSQAETGPAEGQDTKPHCLCCTQPGGGAGRVHWGPERAPPPPAHPRPAVLHPFCQPSECSNRLSRPADSSPSDPAATQEAAKVLSRSATRWPGDPATRRPDVRLQPSSPHTLPELCWKTLWHDSKNSFNTKRQAHTWWIVLFIYFCVTFIYSFYLLIHYLGSSQEAPSTWFWIDPSDSWCSHHRSWGVCKVFSFFPPPPSLSLSFLPSALQLKVGGCCWLMLSSPVPQSLLKSHVYKRLLWSCCSDKPEPANMSWTSLQMVMLTPLLEGEGGILTSGDLLLTRCFFFFPLLPSHRSPWARCCSWGTSPCAPEAPSVSARTRSLSASRGSRKSWPTAAHRRLPTARKRARSPPGPTGKSTPARKQRSNSPYLHQIFVWVHW